MKIDYRIRNEKLQYNINREPAKLSGLSSGKFYKYEYPAGQVIIAPDKKEW